MSWCLSSQCSVWSEGVWVSGVYLLHTITLEFYGASVLHWIFLCGGTISFVSDLYGVQPWCLLFCKFPTVYCLFVGGCACVSVPVHAWACMPCDWLLFSREYSLWLSVRVCLDCALCRGRCLHRRCVWTSARHERLLWIKTRIGWLWSVVVQQHTVNLLSADFVWDGCVDLLLRCLFSIDKALSVEVF